MNLGDLLLAAAAVALLACPAHMLWRSRHGARTKLETLAASQRALAERAEQIARSVPASDGGEPGG